MGLKGRNILMSFQGRYKAIVVDADAEITPAKWFVVKPLSRKKVP
jgi:hypothetical protein